MNTKRFFFTTLLTLFSFCFYSQNVGIGNNNPQSKLHVSGAIRSDTLIGLGVRNLFAAPNGRIYDSLVGALPAWLINGNANIGATNFLGTLNANDLIFKTNNNEVARFLSTGNMGIGTALPNASALVEMVSNTGGLLIPRMTTVQRNAIAAPSNGLLIYDLTVNCLFFYNAGLTVWQSLCTPPLPPGSVDVMGTYPTLTVTGLQTTPVAAITPTTGQILQFNGTSWTPSNGTFWNLLGNAGTNSATNFLGTTDNNDLVFRANNIEHARITTGGVFHNMQATFINPIGADGQGLNTNPGGGASLAWRLNNSGYAGAFYNQSLVPTAGGLMVKILATGSTNTIFDVSTGVQGTAGIPVLAAKGNGNVGVGTNLPAAKLDVVSTTEGFAMPRMTSAQRKAIVSPIVGLQVYDINLTGFYYYDGTKWDCANNPAGTVQYFANTIAPNGYLECNGAAVNRTTYAELFNAIGTTYGAGNGTTTFNVPDLRGEFIRSYDNGKGADPGRVIGTFQSPSPLVHDDTFGVGAQDTDFSMDYAAAGLSDAWPTATVGSIPNAYWGRGNAASPVANWVVYSGANAQGMISGSRPRNVALMPCIKY